MLALRRTLPRGGAGVVACRAPAALRRVLDSRLVDAIVLAPTAALLPELRRAPRRLPGTAGGGLCAVPSRRRRAAPGLPSARGGHRSRWRAWTTRSWARWWRAARSPPSAAGPSPTRRGCSGSPSRSSGRRGSCCCSEVERPVRTTDLARRLRVSREHLSRQFGAGGAPNLKRVIDLTRIACAAQLLANPGLLHSHGGAGPSFRLGQPPGRDRAPDRQRADQRAGRARPPRGAGGLRPGEHPEPVVTLESRLSGKMPRGRDGPIL